MKKRMLIIIAVVLAIIALIVVGSYQFDGPVDAINPQLAIPLEGSAFWYENPRLDANLTDPAAVYVLAPTMPVDDRFAALRIDVRTGEQTATNIVIGPQSPFRSFMPADVRAEIFGLRFRRFTMQLLSLPGGGGALDHFIDSATGRINVVLNERGTRRLLLTRNAFNSSSTEELLARVTTDPSGRWIAAVWQNSYPSDWMLYLFSRSPTSAQPIK